MIYLKQQYVSFSIEIHEIHKQKQIVFAKT